MDCGATSIFITPSLPKQLGISSGGTHHHPRHEQRSNATFKGHQKTRITVQYLDHLAPVDKSDMLVLPLQAYDWVCGLPWFQKQNHDIDWAPLTSLQSPSASGVEEISLMTMAVASKVSEAEDGKVNAQLVGCGPAIQTLGPTTLDDLAASDEVITAFGLQIGECTGLLRSTLEDNTSDSPGNTDSSSGCDKQGAAAVVAAPDPF